MNWFIKVLRHYADFSGRARRTEYWMFVLFYAIFAFAWTFLWTIVYALTGHADTNELTLASYIANLSYTIILMLPGMALAVRRLHDTGKSGWMLPVFLIPLVGQVWLLVLMLTDSQPGDNQYGPNPKTAPETFSDAAKLKSAGVALIVASIFAMIHLIIFGFITPLTQGFAFGMNTFWLSQISCAIGYVLLLSAGIGLLNEKRMYGMHGKGRNAISMLLAAVSIFLIWTLVGGYPSILHFGWYSIRFLLDIIFYLTIVLFAGYILSAQQNRNLIRNMATWVILFSGLYILWNIYFGMGSMQNISEPVYVYQNVFANFYLLLPVAYIVLAGTFLSQTEQNVVAPAPVRTYSPPSKPYVAPTAPTPRSFPPYTGLGVCDVCNRPLGDCKAFIVPNHVFYNSRKYRDYVRNGPMATLMGFRMDDAYFARMQAQDTSQGSAVCESCIHMFE